RSRYLIAAPLTTFGGEQLGILAVEKVPFFALHEEMLQTLNLLLGYYTDGLVTQQLAEQITEALPACPVDFAAELQRLWRVRQESGVRSVIVEFQPRVQLEDMVLQIRRQRRSLDVNWLLEASGGKILVNLMPLASTAAAEGYITRIEDWVQRQGKQTLSEAGIFAHVLHVDEQPPLILLDHLFAVCHVPAEARTLRPDA
ncbi:PelD GGDEF domain-containing protein, partial [bacterium]|nr:PelD GGDEF domain-containing protein [bacterium]